MLEMKCVRIKCGVKQADRVWNDNVEGRCGCGIKNKLLDKVNQGVLKLFQMYGEDERISN